MCGVQVPGRPAVSSAHCQHPWLAGALGGLFGPPCGHVTAGVPALGSRCCWHTLPGPCDQASVAPPGRGLVLGAPHTQVRWTSPGPDASAWVTSRLIACGVFAVRIGRQTPNIGPPYCPHTAGLHKWPVGPSGQGLGCTWHVPWWPGTLGGGPTCSVHSAHLLQGRPMTRRGPRDAGRHPPARVQRSLRKEPKQPLAATAEVWDRLPGVKQR